MNETSYLREQLASARAEIERLKRVVEELENCSPSFSTSDINTITISKKHYDHLFNVIRIWKQRATEAQPTKDDIKGEDL